MYKLIWISFEKKNRKIERNYVKYQIFYSIISTTKYAIYVINGKFCCWYNKVWFAIIHVRPFVTVAMTFLIFRIQPFSCSNSIKKYSRLFFSEKTTSNPFIGILIYRPSHFHLPSLLRNIKYSIHIACYFIFLQNGPEELIWILLQVLGQCK